MIFRLNKKSVKKEIIILLVIILLLGGFLRLYLLDEKELWLDEVLKTSVRSATSGNLKSVILDLLNNIPDNAPFYPSFLYFWIKIFGSYNLILRLPSVIFGLLSILLIYKIVKRMLGYKVGLMSSFIFSINVLHVTFSQEATPYSLLILLSLGSIFFLLNIIDQKKLINYFGYIFFTVLMIYTHYFAWFLIIFQNIFIFLLRKKLNGFIKNWISIQLVILAFFIPWTILLIINYDLLNFNTISLSSKYCSSTDIFYTFSSSGFLVKSRIYEMSYSKDAYNFFQNHSLFDLYYLGIPQFLLFILFITLASFGIYSLIKSKNVNIKFKLFLLLWLLIPLIIKLFIHVSRVNTCDIRYYLLSLPPFLIFISYGIISIKKAIWKIIVILLIIFTSILVYNNYYNIYSEVAFVGPYWQLGQFIPENSTNKEIAKYISFNSKPNLFPYIKIQKDAFEYINKNYPDAIVLTDWITAFKTSSQIHGWIKKPLTTLDTNLNIAEVGSNEFDLVFKITGDGFDHRKSDLVEKTLNKFNVSLVKKWQYYNMSVEIFKNNEK